MEFFLHSAWVIAAIPLLTSALIAMFARSIRDKAWLVGAGGMLVALIWSLGVFAAVATTGGEAHGAAAEGVHAATEAARYLVTPNWHISFEWLKIGDIILPMGLQVDLLTAIMLVVVTLVSFCVQVYSSEYLRGDKRFTRFFSAINLFTLGMLGLVLADNLFLLLVCWEIMGLCSYLLIGHWYEQPWPRMGQIKAFMTTRVGDVGMMVGIWILFMLTKTLTWEGLAKTLPEVAQQPGNAAILALGAVLLFTGAMGKSAQFPLHTWLPDAMAGPTPGSALIHAATMVAAGVYLVSRAFMVYGSAPAWVLAFVAFIGAFTSIFAASIATLRHDIKEVLAYSTISQLGYMIMAMGLGGWTAGNFHLMTHAFFKALLFLAAGAVIHAHHHNQLLHKMGGLRNKIPITFWTWMIGYLALAGFPGFSGFFSKDELLLAAFTWENPAVPHWARLLPFIMGLTTAFLTAYYMTRTTYLAFFGKPRDQHLYDHAHEPPKAMTIPLIILAVPAALSGWLWAALPANTFHIDALLWLEHHLALPGIQNAPGVPAELAHSTANLVTALATTAGFVGIGLGLLFYKVVKPETRAKWIAAGKPIYTLVRNKYYVDELYDVVFIKGTQALSVLVARFDGVVVDGLVNLVGRLGVWIAYAAGVFDKYVIDWLVTIWADLARRLAAGLRRLSTGYVQQYMLTVVIVAVVGVAGVILIQAIR